VDPERDRPRPDLKPGPEPLHVVEPTLVDQTGHCHSFIGALCEAGPEQRFEVWAGRAAAALFPELPQVQLHPHFTRRLRRWQGLRLLYALLRAPGRVFVPTASTTDLLLAHLAARGPLPPGKVSFFFHWLRPGERRRQRLAALARRQPELGVLAATEACVSDLREAGFRRARFAPYPLAPSTHPPADAPAFRHLLFAGAARIDKGFPRVVDLVERLAHAGADSALPLAIQTSARHYGKLDPAVARELERLERIQYPALRTHPQTLERAAYGELFHGAICLQPYDRAEFAERVSAVTVDALARGAPIITSAGTWMGRAVTRWGAGLTLDRPDAAALEQAARAIAADYPRYSALARKAAAAIHEQHSARHLLDAVLSF
jgi:glycosyltransferase involved in cell wall biosynthesis